MNHCDSFHFLSFFFLGLNEKIPFVKPAPIDEQETKKQKKHKDAQAKKGKPEQ